MTNEPIPLPRTGPSSTRRASGLPPHDVAAEEAVLAALMLSDQAYAQLQPLLVPGDFFREQHRWCWEAAAALGERGEPITLTTLAHELEREGRLDGAGGVGYLAELLLRHGSAIGAEAHAAIVQRDARWRRLIGAAGQIAQTAYQGGPDVDRALAEAEALLLEVPAAAAARGLTSYELLRQFLDGGGAGPSAVPSGFATLDALTGGFRAGSLAIVGARTSAGKSALLADIARHAVLAAEPAHVGFFTLEMSALEIMHRQLAAAAQVAPQRLRLGRQTEQEEVRIMGAVDALDGAPMTVFEEPAPTVPEIRARCRRLQATGGLDLVIVDYLQLVRGAGAQRESRAYELAEITRALKELAKDLQVPVIAAAQLSRQIDARPSHVPLLSDLRESGSIEQDADLVVFIHRPRMYGDDEDGAERAGGGEEPARLIVAKNRHGPTGSAAVHFRNHIVSFRDAANQEELPWRS